MLDGHGQLHAIARQGAALDEPDGEPGAFIGPPARVDGCQRTGIEVQADLHTVHPELDRVRLPPLLRLLAPEGHRLVAHAHVEVEVRPIPAHVGAAGQVALAVLADPRQPDDAVPGPVPAVAVDLGRRPDSAHLDLPLGVAAAKRRLLLPEHARGLVQNGHPGGLLLDRHLQRAVLQDPRRSLSSCSRGQGTCRDQTAQRRQDRDPSHGRTSEENGPRRTGTVRHIACTVTHRYTPARAKVQAEERAPGFDGGVAHGVGSVREPRRRPEGERGQAALEARSRRCKG